MPDLATAALPATAAAASLVYLNARWSVPNDWNLLYSLARARISFARRLKRDRINNFYLLEDFARAPSTADKPFLVYNSKTWTFKDTYNTALRYAGWLHQTHQVQPGEIVAVDFMNSPSFIFLTFALWSLGAIPAFINYNLAGPPLIHSIRVSTARLVIVDPEIQQNFTSEVLATLSSPTFRKDSLPLGTVILTPQLESSLAYFPPHRAPDASRGGLLPRTPAALISTSGTTGLPKAAIVPWDRLSVGAGTAARWIGFRPVTSKSPDRYYTCMPLYHGTAFILAFNLCLISGTTLVLGHKFSSKAYWNEVREGQATAIQYVGETLRYLMSVPADPVRDLDNKVRLAFGNGLRPDVWDRFKARFGVETIAEFYGSTEGSSANWNLSSNSFSSGAIGRNGLLLELLLGGMQTVVKVDWETEEPWRDPTTGFCEKVPRGEVGELLYALDPKDIKDKFGGYFGNEEATQKKVMWNVLKKGDAWFRTGDVVRWDKEGRLWFSDRIGDTFRWKSENVSTSEVSEALGRHPRISEANVYGVQLPGHEGRAGCAAVLLDTPEELSTANLESIATWARNSLPKYAVPVFLRVSKTAQSTGNNKQQKQTLRKEGVDPSLVSGGEKVYWLRPGSSAYSQFGKEGVG